MEWNIIDVEEVKTDGQEENFKKMMEWYQSLNRLQRRKVFRERKRCKRLNPRTMDKKWSQRQIKYRNLQCK